MIMTLIPMLMKILIKIYTLHKKQIHFHVHVMMMRWKVNYLQTTIELLYVQMLKMVLKLLWLVVPIHKVDAGERNHKQSIPLILRLIAQVKLLQQPLFMHFKFF